MLIDYQAPIVLMAFNRPQYFESVLQSLVEQEGISLGQRDVWLFLDGSINPFSSICRAPQELIDQSLDLFKRYFPEGLVFSATHNLGVALNFDRAERYAFEETRSEACIFLEDDMVLSKHYIRILDTLVNLALGDARIGYVAAYGDYTKTAEKQKSVAGRFRMLRQNWAFGLTRSQWLKNRPYVEQYLSLVRDGDYSQRNSRRVYDLYSSWGMDRVESSQDRAKLNACTLTGGLRLNTSAVFGQYIGRVGLHSYEELFLKSGFDKTEIFPEENIEFETFTDELYSKLFAEQRRWVQAPLPLITRDMSLQFGIDGSGLKALRQSFHKPERWGSWSAAKQSHIVVRAPAAATSEQMFLELALRHFVPGKSPDVTLSIFCNNALAATVNVGRTQSTVRIRIPQGCVPADGTLDIRFDSSLIGSPSDYGMGGDSRVLSIGVSSMTLLTGGVESALHKNGDGMATLEP